MWQRPNFKRDLCLSRQQTFLGHVLESCPAWRETLKDRARLLPASVREGGVWWIRPSMHCLNRPITRIAWDIPRSKQKDGRLIGLDRRGNTSKVSGVWVRPRGEYRTAKMVFKYDTAGDSLRHARFHTHSKVRALCNKSGKKWDKVVKIMQKQETYFWF